MKCYNLSDIITERNVMKNFLITSACWLWLLVRYTDAVRFYVKEYGDGAPIISKTEMIATFKT